MNINNWIPLTEPNNLKIPRFTALFPSEEVGLNPIMDLLPMVVPSCSENQGLDLISDKYKMRFGIDLVPQDKTEQSVLAYRIATDSNLCSEVTTVKTRAPANSQTLQAQNTCAPPTSAN